jgi:hypothetical protein
MLTGNMHAQRFGMPDYIRRLRAQGQPVVQSEPLPEMGAPPMAAPAPPPHQTNAAPIGIMPQGAQHTGGKPKFDMGLFNQSFEKPKKNWADHLGIIGGYLMDLDGSFGAGNADRFERMYDERVGEARSEFDTKRQQQLMMAAAQGDMNAMFMLDPSLALGEKRDRRNFGYQQGRDAKADDQFERMWLRDEGRYETEREFRERVQNFTESNADRNFNLESNLGYGRLEVDKERNRITAAENTPQTGGIAPALSGLPAGVQSAIVTKELTGLDTSEEAVGKARNAANIARSFMADAEGYGSLGGGPLADIGQAASQKTAQLKGHTARMIPMMRSPGEGEMTDSDAKRYELSVVSINKGRAANQSVVDDLERFEANEVARDKFLREWQAQNGYGSVSQAKLIWQQYADAEPIFDPESGKPRERKDIYSWMGGASQTPQATGAPAPTSKQEYDALPSGAVFQAPDGSMRRKP